jgi:hypothetical protein
MQPSLSKFIKIAPCSRATKLVNFQIISTLSNESCTKFCSLCLKLLLPTILTPSLPFYPYQKDERALLGYLLTICSFSERREKISLSLCFKVLNKSVQYFSVMKTSFLQADLFSRGSLGSWETKFCTSAPCRSFHPVVIKFPRPVQIVGFHCTIC